MDSPASRTVSKPTASTDPLTPIEAQALQDDATARGVWLIWFINDADPAHPGKVTARAHTEDHIGGVYLPGALVADTLDELRDKMPAGLTRRDRAPVDPAGIVETWD